MSWYHSNFGDNITVKKVYIIVAWNDPLSQVIQLFRIHGNIFRRGMLLKHIPCGWFCHTVSNHKKKSNMKMGKINI